MKSYQGKLQAKGLKIAIVVSRFNSSSRSACSRGPWTPSASSGPRTPTSPSTRCPARSRSRSSSRRSPRPERRTASSAWAPSSAGDTPHFDFLGAEVTKGLAQIALDEGVPVSFGILTVDTIEQGIERAGTKAGQQGLRRRVLPRRDPEPPQGVRASADGRTGALTMGKRRKARECALQILFQLEFNAGRSRRPSSAVYWEHQKAADDVREYGDLARRGRSGPRPGEVDGAIQAASENWRIARMAVVDRNILRIAVFELLRSRRRSSRPSSSTRPSRSPRDTAARRPPCSSTAILDAVRKTLEAGNDSRAKGPMEEKDDMAKTRKARSGRRPKPRSATRTLARREKLRKLAEAGVELFPHTGGLDPLRGGIVAEFSTPPQGGARGEEAGRDGPRQDPVHPEDGPGHVLSHLRRPLPAPGLYPGGRGRGRRPTSGSRSSTSATSSSSPGRSSRRGRAS